MLDQNQLLPGKKEDNGITTQYVDAAKNKYFVIWQAIILLLLIGIGYASVTLFAQFNQTIATLELAVKHLNIAEEKYEQNTSELLKSISILNSTNLTDQGLQQDAHKFALLKLAYNALCKIKNGQDIKQEIEDMGIYADGSITDLLAEIKDVISKNEYLANQEVIKNLTDFAANISINELANQKKSLSGQAKTSFPIFNQLIKIENIEETNQKNYINIALNALEDNDLPEAIDSLKNLANLYPSINDIIKSLQIKNNLNGLLKQITDKIIKDA